MNEWVDHVYISRPIVITGRDQDAQHLHRTRKLENGRLFLLAIVIRLISRVIDSVLFDVVVKGTDQRI